MSPMKQSYFTWKHSESHHRFTTIPFKHLLWENLKRFDQDAMKFVLLFLMGLFKSTLKSYACFILGFAGGSLLENSFIYLWKKSLYKKERKSAINKKKLQIIIKLMTSCLTLNRNKLFLVNIQSVKKNW